MLSLSLLTFVQMLFSLPFESLQLMFLTLEISQYLTSVSLRELILKMVGCPRVHVGFRQSPPVGTLFGGGVFALPFGAQGVCRLLPVFTSHDFICFPLEQQDHLVVLRRIFWFRLFSKGIPHGMANASVLLFSHEVRPRVGHELVDNSIFSKYGNKKELQH